LQVFTSLDEFRARGETAVSVGVFDGFHVGHARVIGELVSAARERGLVACVLTFTTHPRKVLSGEPLDLVTSAEHRLALLERAGVDVAVAMEFTREFASLAVEAFVEDVLRGKLGARLVVLGPDARLGAGRAGDAARLREAAGASGIEVRVVEPVYVGGQPVSSTRVREAVQSGDLAAAEALLGRRISVLGQVVPGRGVGRRLGFPTANLDVRREVRLPYGVYAAWAHVENERLPSVANVGSRPTFSGAAASVAGQGLRADRLVEAHILEPTGREIYGRTVELEFVKKLRDERRFGTDAELAAQIARDAEAARRVLSEDGAR